MSLLSWQFRMDGQNLQRVLISVCETVDQLSASRDDEIVGEKRHFKLNDVGSIVVLLRHKAAIQLPPLFYCTVSSLGY
ncbi:hypothetical protein PILCRDRAFT_820785 [Piloderma croceum F 1598]|uniref:Uncharacterized protein n=1 Tax=Piloderma croceum (strain F 1598) TaxID=765440 RepID=A0A0C3FB63_PILCF|nr:hypothetical protein PILCRDRAFT_820785 [Piloderma croceum F 1598]